MSVSEDREKYPNRYALADGGRVYEQPWNRDDAEHYLNEWHNKGYTGNYVPKALYRNVPATGKVKAKWGSKEEERVTNPVTGGEKGRKVCEPAFVDPVALEALGRVAGKGRRKYDKYNYLRGYDWSLSANALQRHFLAFWSGEDYDEESGELHMAHAAWHALALVSFLARGLGEDDRPPDDQA